MNGRERLSRTLRHEPVDRVPIAPFLYYNAVYEMFGYRPTIENFFDPADFDPITSFVAYCDCFGFDVLHTLGTAWEQYNLDRPGEDWDVVIAWEGTGDERRKIVEIRTPGGRLRQTINYRRSSAHLIVSAIDEYLIKTPEDFEIVSRYAPVDLPLDCRLVTRARSAVGDKGLVDANIHGAFNTLNTLRKLDDVMADPLLDEGLYRAMISWCTEWNLRNLPQLVAAGADVIEFAGNMATSAVGPRFFSRFVLQYEQRIAQAIRELGAFSIYHNCGDAGKIMHLYNELGMDCWGYLTPRPFGDVDLDQALNTLRPDLALRGNIDQVDFMVNATPVEVRERVRDLLLTVKPRGGWILSTTDFFFDGTPYANIHALADAGHEFGAY